MESRIVVVKNFISKLKSMETPGQGCGYPFWFLYKDEFHELDSLISDYEEIIKICNCSTRERYNFDD